MGHESPVNAALARARISNRGAGFHASARTGHAIVSTTSTPARSFAACPSRAVPAVISGCGSGYLPKSPSQRRPYSGLARTKALRTRLFQRSQGPQRESHLARSSVEAHRVQQRSMNPLQTGKSSPSARFDLTRRMPQLARTRPHVTRAVKKSLQDTDSFSGRWNSTAAARRANSPPVSQAPRPPHAWPAARLSRAIADPVRAIGQVRPASEQRRGGIASGASTRQVEPPPDERRRPRAIPVGVPTS